MPVRLERVGELPISGGGTGVKKTIREIDETYTDSCGTDILAGSRHGRVRHRLR
jgi:hypothetical protein